MEKELSIAKEILEELLDSYGQQRVGTVYALELIMSELCKAKGKEFKFTVDSEDNLLS